MMPQQKSSNSDRNNRERNNQNSSQSSNVWQGHSETREPLQQHSGYSDRNVQEQNSQHSSQPPNVQQSHSQNKEPPQQQQHAYLPTQSPQRQSYYTPHSNHKIYVLPYPAPSYSGPQQHSEQFSSQPPQPYLQYPSVGYHQYPSHSGYAFQPPPNQTGQDQKHFSSQSGPQVNQDGPSQLNSDQLPVHQNVIYLTPYPLPPPSAQDTSMIRAGRRTNRIESHPVGWEGFQEQDIRTVFVRKVYIILTLQLLITLGIIALFVFEPNVKRFIQQNTYLYYISLAIFVAVYIGMACFQSLRRTFPMNIVALTVFTLAMSYMLGTISSFHQTEGVFMAVGICAAVCLAVTLFSFYTKFDFTSCGSILCILLLMLFLFGLIAIFVPSPIMTKIYAATGAVVFTLFLAYDTQMLMGGKKIEISPEEYIFAAVQIYIDVIYIFLFILMLINYQD